MKSRSFNSSFVLILQNFSVKFSEKEISAKSSAITLAISCFLVNIVLFLVRWFNRWVVVFPLYFSNHIPDVFGFSVCVYFGYIVMPSVSL